MAILKDDDVIQGAPGIIRYAPPTHFTFKVESFSLLSESSIERYESGEFESGGYRWKLILYPNGNKNEKGEDHLSLYLTIVERNFYPGWEVNAAFRFLLYDKIRDKYLAVGDWGGIVRRFHSVKTEWGVSKLIPLTAFKDPSAGYVVDDNCVFGAEVFVCERTGNGETLSMVKEPLTVNHTWKIDRFSKMNDTYDYSKSFSTGAHSWVISLYPKGYSESSDEEGDNTSDTDNTNEEKKWLSVYIEMEDDLKPNERFYADIVLRLKNQIYEEDIEYTGSSWFDESSDYWGHDNFLKLDDFHDATKGFLVDDSCILEAQVTVRALVKQSLVA
ncbi:hypothetical protein ACHQM5_010008 [Ranunculus cassubicifolius]